MVRCAFTLMELLVVLSIIGVLAGLMIPAGTLMMNRRAVLRTQTLVSAVSAAIQAYPVSTWEVRAVLGGRLQTVTYARMWDMNGDPAGSTPPGDGLIDGRPDASNSATTDGPFWQPLIDSGYRGFTAMAMPDLPSAQRNQREQPVDAWGQPLRITFGQAFAPAGFRVASDGLDGSPGTADDITSVDRP